MVVVLALTSLLLVCLVVQYYNRYRGKGYQVVAKEEIQLSSIKDTRVDMDGAMSSSKAPTVVRGPSVSIGASLLQRDFDEDEDDDNDDEDYMESVM